MLHCVKLAPDEPDARHGAAVRAGLHQSLQVPMTLVKRMAVVPRRASAPFAVFAGSSTLAATRSLVPAAAIAP
jgi:hypothetical protein